MLGIQKFLISAILLSVTIFLPMHGFSQAATGSLLQNSTLYPRVVRLTYGPTAVNGRLIASTDGRIFQSLDNGNSWTQISTVPTATGSFHRCCTALYEMPRTVGSLAAGTLLAAGSNLQNSVPAIEIYTSTDQGQTWTYHSRPVRSGNLDHGLWEAQFEIANDGALVMFWSDETDPCCSQKLAQIRTYTGDIWQDQTNTVATTNYGDRPGMITVSKLPNNHFFMTYELCGPAACTVFYRTSTDGWNFGTPTNAGTRVQTASGQWLEHAPLNTWTTSPLSSNGALILVGQVMFEPNGQVSPSNGKVLFVNTNVDGAGNWYTITAPVKVPNAYDNYCPNYSSALLPATDGSNILELASAYNSDGYCATYSAQETWNSLPTDGAQYAFLNQAVPSLCLDNTGWSAANNTAAEVWTCNNAPVQNWTVHAKGNGFFSIQNQQTGLCVDNTGGSQTPGNKATLWGCNNSGNQNWLFLDVGAGAFKFQNQAAASLLLEAPANSLTAGTQLQINTDSDLDSQHWLLQARSSGPTDGAQYIFVNQGATSLCLDNTAWSTANNTSAEVWTCNNAPVQNWILHAKGGGYFSIQNQQTGLCVDNTGGSNSPGNKVTLWGCANNSNQNWLFVDAGGGAYKLLNQASGSLLLEDPAASLTAGTQLQINTDTGLQSQHWILR